MDRRFFLGGVAALGAVSVLPAPVRAQFDFGSLAKGAVGLVGAYTSGESDEIAMGEQYYTDYLAKSGGAYPDRNAQEALRSFAQPVMAAAERKSLPWEITLVKNAQVNAWALPGGKLAINSALVSHCKTPDELASVIAHEVGHADLGHGLSQIRNKALVTTAGGLGKEALTSWLGGAGGGIGAQALNALEGPLYNLILSGYSRANEFEADGKILAIFERTGFDPAKADDFFHTLLKLHPQSDNATTSLFSTHPGTKDRIAKIEAAASGRAGGSKSTPKGWAELKSRFPTPA